MKIHFIRHATLVIQLNGKNILVDPMLSPAESWDAVRNTPNPRRNPLVALPFDEAGLQSLIDSTDAVIVTHLHGDHWDAKAQEMIPKTTPIFCQPEDEVKISGQGFEDVRPVGYQVEWGGAKISRTSGQHGTGTIGMAMAPVSGFVIEEAGSPKVYIAGDTIWCPEVDAALETHFPDVVIVNTGAAQFLTGDPITMTEEDVIQVCRAARGARLVAVHMESINHCLLKRDALSAAMKEAGVSDQVIIPEDGEHITIES